MFSLLWRAHTSIERLQHARMQRERIGLIVMESGRACGDRAMSKVPTNTMHAPCRRIIGPSEH